MCVLLELGVRPLVSFTEMLEALEGLLVDSLLGNFEIEISMTHQNV